MSRMEGSGLSIDLPTGWEGNISGGGFQLLSDGAREPTVLHASNFPLPAQRGSFGSGATDTMGLQDVFITLFEYGEKSLGTALFAAQGVPRELLPGDFDRHMLQQPLPGQSGIQHFFTENDRAFCLYVVLGSHLDRADLVPRVNDVLRTIVIT